MFDGTTCTTTSAKLVDSRLGNLTPPTTMFTGTTSTTESTKLVQNSRLDKITPARKPVFDDDYRLTDEDHEVAVFIRLSHEPADVAKIGDYDLTAQHLMPNVNRGFYYDQVRLLC
jgi:hypothetical protein